MAASLEYGSESWVRMSEDSPTGGFDAMAEFVQRFPAADVETVYGEPVTRGDRTVVPVARVGYRFGGGFGSGGGSSEAEEHTGYGGGGGGAVTAEPAGALEISPEGTRFVDTERRWPLLVAFLIGALLGWLGRR
jgi:uncharacterized spore protein YtfJ